MKVFYLFLTVLLISCSAKNEISRDINVIPKPNSLKFQKGVFKATNSISIKVENKTLLKPAQLFVRRVHEKITIKNSDSNHAQIKLRLKPGTKTEEYNLRISKNEIIIESSSPHGIFNGLQTLAQLILFSSGSNNEVVLPQLKINDSPQYSWRGLMIDESRYFFGKEKIKQVLDLMALHKLTIFHWHLTDVPGWRIEIKKYPKLTTVGAIGNDIDHEAAAQFYSQNDIKEIVDYADDRFIEIIPEIDMPGHATAANRAYPEFSGGGSKSHPEFTFNPGNENTYQYLSTILKEVSQLFPSKYIHIGGDEVHYGNATWNTDPFVQKLMKDKKLQNLKEVEGYFVNRIADTLKVLNKTLVGWDEITEHGTDKNNSVVMWWRHNLPETLNRSLSEGYKVVLCPRIPLYFDFDQHKTHQYGRKWKGEFSSVDLVYNFPPDTLAGFKEHKKQILGIQANLWTERIQSDKRFDYMLFPRLSALSEAAWTSNQNKNLKSFNKRLISMFHYLDGKKIYYFDCNNPGNTPEPVGKLRNKQN